MVRVFLSVRSLILVFGNSSDILVDTLVVLHSFYDGGGGAHVGDWRWLLNDAFGAMMSVELMFYDRDVCYLYGRVSLCP